MANGPFDSYAPPGVYTRTLVQQDNSGAPVGARIPVFVGTGKETLSQTDLEIVRGSSASVDQRIVNEDVDPRFILDDSNPDAPIFGAKSGTEAKFQVANYPVVSGNGSGTTTNNTQHITVTVDGELVAPAALDGARGIVTLQVPPQPSSEVRVTYFFNRTDTLITDDVSSQVTATAANIFGAEIAPFDIVTGANVLIVTVNGVDAAITLPTGTGRTADNIANDINAAGIAGLTASADTDNQGSVRLLLSAQGSIAIGAGSVNTVLGFFAGQRTSRNRLFHTYQAPIVDGTNGGITTTNPADIDVFVDGVQVLASEVDGANGAVLLAQAPPVGSTVLIRYHFNTWQDTFDYLPNMGIRDVLRVGVSPGRTDYIEGNDYIIDESGRILWGAAVTIESGAHTTGAEFFDDTQISATLVDNKIYLEPVTKYIDNTISPPTTSNTQVVLGNVPTIGNGRNTPLDARTHAALDNNRQTGVQTHRPDLVKVYHGASISEAVARGAVTVTGVDPKTRRVTVADPIPVDHKVWATYYYSRLQDNVVTARVLSQSTPTTPGTYTLASQRTGLNLYGVRFGTTGTVDTIQWPSGVESNPDAFITGVNGVEETVTVTFKKEAATPATFTNGAGSPYDTYAGTSDNLHVTVDGNALTVDLSQPGFGVIVSDAHDDGATFTFVPGANDEFKFEVDNVLHTVTLQPGDTGANIADRISRAVQTQAQISGTVADTAGGGADFVIAGTTTYDLTINGTNFTQAGAALSASTYTAADLATELNTKFAASSGLTAGDVTVPGNDFHVVANPNGTLTILASESVQVNTTSNGGDELDTLVGFTPLDTLVSNTAVATYRNVGTDNEHLILRSQVTPAGPNDVSRIRVFDGSANATLGFDDFQEAYGAESAVVKAATLVSGAISAADMTNLENSPTADFIVRMNGSQFTVDLSGLVAPTASTVASAINTAISAQGSAVLEGANRIRITSNVATNNSRVEVMGGNANAWLHFDEGDIAVQRKATAGELVSVLNSQVAANWDAPSDGTDFIASAFAEEYTDANGLGFIRLQTFAVGTSATLVFTAGPASALNDTGIGISIGDSAAGSSETDAFDVASDAGAVGSSGSGVVGQTYTDARTGLRFTILPAEDGAYTATESFTLVVSQTFSTGTSRVVKAASGVELVVANTTGVGVGDTAIINLFNASGSEPGVGDYYYITYEYEKADFSTQLFTRFRDVQSHYGDLSPDNPLTLAAYLAFLNGAVIVGCKQVLKQPGLTTAASQSYNDALLELAKPLGAGVKPDILVPLSTDPDVMGNYVQHAEVQSSMRFRSERRCVFGVASGTRPNDAANVAKGLKSERAILVYPDSAVITLANAEGTEESYIVDGTYMAAALAGTLSSPQYDVAQPLTRRNIAGFSRLNRALDDVEMNQLATAGVSVLLDRGTNLQVRDGLTTNVDSRFTGTPSIVAIKDYVQQQARATLDRFVGLKFLTSRAQDVEAALTGLLNALVESDVIVDFRGVTAEPDTSDPTTLRVQAFYAPVFPLKYIVITFTIGASSTI